MGTLSPLPPPGSGRRSARPRCSGGLPWSPASTSHGPPALGSKQPPVGNQLGWFGWAVETVPSEVAAEKEPSEALAWASGGAVRGQSGRPRHSHAGAGPRGVPHPPRPGALHAPTDVEDRNRGRAGRSRTGRAGVGASGSPSLHPPCPGWSTPPAGTVPPARSSREGTPFPLLGGPATQLAPAPLGGAKMDGRGDWLLRRPQHTVTGSWRGKSPWLWHRCATAPLTEEMEIHMKFLSPSKRTDCSNPLRRHHSRWARTDPGSPEDGDVNGSCNHLENNLSLCIHQPGQAGV